MDTGVVWIEIERFFQSISLSQTRTLTVCSTKLHPEHGGLNWRLHYNLSSTCSVVNRWEVICDEPTDTHTHTHQTVECDTLVLPHFVLTSHCHTGHPTTVVMKPLNFSSF